MKLAFSTNAFTRFPLVDALAGIKAAGFDGVEILADVPHAYVKTMSAVEIALIGRELERLDLAISNVNANCTFGYWRDAPPEPYFEPSLISPNPKHRQDRADLIRQTLAMARAWGAANISITSGRCLGGMPPHKAAAQFKESIKPLLDEAVRLNVAVGIESEPGLFIEYASELRDWITTLGCPLFGANLDIGHSVVLGETIEEAIGVLAPSIWNMHVEDLPGRKHYHLIPGEGTFEWATLRDTLQKVGYDRFLTVELYTETADPHRAAERSAAFLRAHFK